MYTKCPACSSLDVRRSSRRRSEVSAHRRLRSAYRCRDCGERFWVINRRAYFLAGIAGAAMMAAAVAWSVGGAPSDRRNELERTTPAASIADTVMLAEKNDAAAEYKLAHLYAQGAGVRVDKKQARGWLERAAQHGNAEAQFELGSALRDGFGVVQDYERAAEWLQRAAENGNGDAQYALAQMYRAGTGVSADPAKAYTWFNVAAAQGAAGAAAQRDSVVRLLSPDQVVKAQAEAIRLSDAVASKQPIAGH